MSTTYQPYALELALPWSGHKEREDAFRKILKRVLIPLLLLCLIFPWLALFETEEVPPEPKIMTKILLDPPKPVKPPPPPPQVVREEPKPVPVKPAKTPEAPKPKAVPKSQPAPVAKAPKVDARTQVAQSQGLSELSSQLKSLRGSVNVARMQNKNVSINEGGTVAASDRSVLGSENASRKSDGIVVNENVMRGESVALAQHQSTKVEGVVGGDSEVTSELGQLSGQSGKRDMESIRRTLEQAKGNVYSLYQRALLDHPNLSGKFTFKIVIEPNGSISTVKLVASELGISDLEQRILERIRQVNFGAKDVPPTAVEYKFVFLPS
ncbi:MAG TPA: AgmX/PglI C-terminal domain-containing protein [Cellvibrio sp.]|nr:AgmX/PglI C-terminal domain-containing protein [Cellvibrio sp.]